MDDSENRNPASAFSVLRRFVRQRAVVERCEMCSAELLPEHEHVVDVSTRKMTCACQACAILFSGKANSKFRRVPRRINYLSNFRLTDSQWESLLIPISMAFFFHSTAAGKVIALYPSPAGATESLLDLESWEELVHDNPVLREIEPDTEALLVNRVRGTEEYYLLPIDECYKLVGIIRKHWHGLSGGTQMWEAIGQYFTDLRKKAIDTGAKTKAASSLGARTASSATVNARGPDVESVAQTCLAPPVDADEDLRALRKTL